jgi:hypothetical protein
MLKVLLYTYSSLEECQLTRTAFGLSQGSPAQFTPIECHLPRLYAAAYVYTHQTHSSIWRILHAP